MAVEVGDLVRAVGERPQFGVPTGDDEVVDDEVAVGGAADTDGGTGEQRADAGRLPEGAGQGRVRDPGGPGTGPGRRAVDENGARAVRGAAEAQLASGADDPFVDAVAVCPGAVGAALVLDGPVVAVGAQERVVPGDAGVVEADLAQGVATDVIDPARAHLRGTEVGLQDELGRRRHTGPLDHEQIFPRSGKTGTGPA